eukprot:GHRR01018449.1.p1 GENE.GHRR01018449.1~~GHRR01018449.1.p1  ORF type:complete len:430 (+),score=136.16 GHRR01018449.1:204-1493(+)
MPFATAALIMLLGLAAILPQATSQQQGFTCPLPASYIIKTDNVCQSLLLTTPGNTFSCKAIVTVDRLAAAVSPLMCRPSSLQAPVAADARGRPIPQPLPNRQWPNSTLQQNITDANSTLNAEGGTYYWHYRNIINLFNWASCEALGQSGITLPTPAGWTLLTTLNLTQGASAINTTINSTAGSTISNVTATDTAGNTTAASTIATAAAVSAMPIAAVLKPDAAGKAERQQSCQAFAAAPETLTVQSNSTAEDLCGGDQLVVVVRGTLSAYEWTLDLSYNQTADESFGPGSFHAGFHHAAAEIWPQLEPVLQQQLIQGNGTITQLTIAAHSLGAGVAQLLAAKAQKYLANSTQGDPAWQGRPLLVTAMLFAAPSAGTEDFTAYFNKHVNARLVRFVFDVVPQVKYTPLVGRCLRLIITDAATVPATDVTC